MTLSRTPYQATGLHHGQYGYWFGAQFQRNPGTWVIDPIGTELKGAPVSAATRTELLRWLKATPVTGDTSFARWWRATPAPAISIPSPSNSTIWSASD